MGVQIAPPRRQLLVHLSNVAHQVHDGALRAVLRFMIAQRRRAVTAAGTGAASKLRSAGSPAIALAVRWTIGVRLPWRTPEGRQPIGRTVFARMNTQREECHAEYRPKGAHSACRQARRCRRSCARHRVRLRAGGSVRRRQTRQDRRSRRPDRPRRRRRRGDSARLHARLGGISGCRRHAGLHIRDRGLGTCATRPPMR